MSNNYDSKNIDVLEGLEAVRKRPGMYIGNVSSKGLHHLVWEIVDNSVDEVLAGFANSIKVTLTKDNEIIVADDGRGIPTDLHPKTQISTVETVFTKLHAGGKFGGENSVYKTAGGLHGVGASVVNALSKYLEVTIQKNNKEYFIRFENGGKATSQLKEVGEATGSGTKVKFKPDETIFDEIEFDINTICARMQQMAYLNRGLKIIVEDKQKETSKIFQYDGGIVEYVEFLNKGKEVIHKTIVSGEGKHTVKNKLGNEEEIEVHVAMQYNTTYQPNINTYVNNIATIEGGTHLKGFEDALFRIMSKFADQKNSKKTTKQKNEEIKLTREDCKEGLTAVISVRVQDPIYEGQTKAKLANSEVRKAVNSIISGNLEKFFFENPEERQTILDKATLAAKARLNAIKAKETTRRKNFLEYSTLPGKLADCSSKNPAESEIFIVEGDSAGGSAKLGRDRNTQAILPLRGKIINAEKNRLSNLLANNEITSIITAIGASIGEDLNLEKLRYHKIVIMTDADVDGSHIRTLLLTFLFRHMRPIIEGGYVYIAQPPLYKISTSQKNFQYAYNDKERDEILSKLTNKKVSIQRYKGLGEMNYDQLWETTMDPEQRKLLKVEIDDATRASMQFSILMGEDVQPRKEFIQDNAKYAKNVDIT